MSASPSTRALYLGEPPDQAFAVLHRASRSSGLAVVLCPPFGWEEVTSYRVRRGWADHLASRGVDCLRLSLPGTGDSGAGPRDPDRVAAWTLAIDQAARVMREETGAHSVIALGIGLGGLLACHAAATHRCLDAVVLWASPATGAEFVRQTRAFARMERSTFWGSREPRSALRDGEMEAGGFVLAGQTIADLDALDIEAMELGPACPGGALLLERDGIAVDDRLVGAFAGTDASVRPGDGYAAMTSHPQTAEMPFPVIATVDGWLDERMVGPAAMRASPPAPVRTADALELEPGVRERPITVSVDGVALRGVLCTPEQTRTDMAAVFLNAGAQRRIGPNRMWVEAARRWADRGVSSVRLDVEGIGDSDGGLTPYRANGTLHTSERVAQVIAALHELRGHGVADRFLVVGLCGGAYWAFHSLLQEPTVCAAVPLNANAIVWAEDLAPSRDLRRVFTDRSWALIRKNATPERLGAVARWLASTPARWSRALVRRVREGPRTEPTTDDHLDALLASGKRLTLVFSEREPLVDELMKSGRLAELERSDTVTIARLAVNDHTLRPTWAQREAHRVLDGALAAELHHAGVEELIASR